MKSGFQTTFSFYSGLDWRSTALPTA